MDGGKNNSSDDRSSHPDGKQSVDDMDEEHGPPDPLRGTSGLYEQYSNHLDHQHHQDDHIAHDPHVVLVKSVPVADYHEHEREEDGHRKYHHVRYARSRSPTGAVKAQHDRVHQHKYAHEHSQAALVETEKVALVEPLQLLRLEFFGFENVHDAGAARHEGKVYFGHDLFLVGPRLGSPLFQTQLHGLGSHLAVWTFRGHAVVVSALLSMVLPSRPGPEADPADGRGGSPGRPVVQIILLRPPAVGPGELPARRSC